jgi:hypothetical protein
MLGSPLVIVIDIAAACPTIPAVTTARRRQRDDVVVAVDTVDRPASAPEAA